MEYKNTYNSINKEGKKIRGLEGKPVSEEQRSGRQEGRLLNNSNIDENLRNQQNDNSYSSIPLYFHTSDIGLTSRPLNFLPSDSPLAFFDSGVGGLTVFSKVKKLLPNENYLYFGDTKNMPYGEKTEEQLLEFADNIFRFFEGQGAKAVIMACNTTSAVTYEKLKNNYKFKIYPIIQSVCKELANLSGVKKLGIIATPATIKSHAYSKEIAKYNPEIEVFELSAPNWVRIVEEHRIYQPQSIDQVKEILDIMKDFEPDKIVLACTHYPYLMDILKKFLPKNTFIDPAINFAKIIKEDLEKNGMLNIGEFEYEKFFVSSDPENFKEASKMFYQLNSLPEVINFNI